LKQTIIISINILVTTNPQFANNFIRRQPVSTLDSGYHHAMIQNVNIYRN